MLPQTFAHLRKALRELMWDGKSSPVSLETLMASRSQGGKNLLDLGARNDTLQLMKLKSYANLDPETRATWAIICDGRLEKIVTKDSNMREDDVLFNMFLQTWKPDQRKWPKQHKSMLKYAKKYGIKLDTIDPSADIKGNIPLWHHLREDPSKTQQNSTLQCRCLRDRHKVIYVKDAPPVLCRLEDRTHVHDMHCVCEDCCEDRLVNKCENPNACIAALERKLSALIPKWDPRHHTLLARNANGGKNDPPGTFNIQGPDANLIPHRGFPCYDQKPAVRAPNSG